MSLVVTLGERERAEIARSGNEAAGTAKLRISARTLSRYAAPPASTPYPLEYAFHLVGDVHGQRVLDLGCGSGLNSLILASRGAIVCGLDISESLVRLAVQRFAANGLDGRARFLVGSAHAFPVPDQTLDLVVGIAVLHHLELEGVGAEVHRVLRPGGRAIFLEPIRDSRFVQFARRVFPNRSDEISPYERPLKSEEITRFAKRFSHFTAKRFSLPHVRVGEKLRLSHARIRRLYQNDRALLDRWRGLERFASICVMELTK